MALEAGLGAILEAGDDGVAASLEPGVVGVEASLEACLCSVWTGVNRDWFKRQS